MRVRWFLLHFLFCPASLLSFPIQDVGEAEAGKSPGKGEQHLAASPNATLEYLNDIQDFLILIILCHRLNGGIRICLTVGLQWENMTWPPVGCTSSTITLAVHYGLKWPHQSAWHFPSMQKQVTVPGRLQSIYCYKGGNRCRMGNESRDKWGGGRIRVCFSYTVCFCYGG